MGWYTVKKKIKGNVYLYRQRTYRESGKVRTESHYIGPESSDFNQERVDGIERSIAEARRKRDEVEEYDVCLEFEIEKTSVGAVNTTEDEQVEDRNSVNRSGKKSTDEKLLSPVIFGEGLEDYNISKKGIEGEARKMRQQLINLHISHDHWQIIRVKRGGDISHTKTAEGYILLLPKEKPEGREYAIPARRHMRHALAAQYIDLLQEHRPSLCEQIKTLCDDDYRASKYAMIRYLLDQKKSPSIALTLQLLITGYIPKKLRKKNTDERI